MPKVDPSEKPALKVGKAFLEGAEIASTPEGKLPELFEERKTTEKNE
jgi:hypothetical protein